MKPSMTIIHRLLLASLLPLIPLRVGAEITLVDSVAFASTTGSLDADDGDGNDNIRTVTLAELGDFDANGTAKLVVSIGGEGSGNGSGNNSVTGVTYGGTPMAQAAEGYRNNRGSSIWYLDNVSVSGEFVITFAGDQGGLGFAAYALNGTLPGGPAAMSTTTATSGTASYYEQIALTTTVEGEFIVVAFARNNFDNSNDGTDGRDAGTGSVAPLIEAFYGDTDGSSAAGAYQLVESPGVVTPTVFDLTNQAGTVLAVSFQPGASGLLFPLTITPNASNPGNYDFEWEGQEGMLYDLVSATDLSTPPDTWAAWEGQVDLVADPPTNTLENLPGGGDARRFFAVVEKEAPPPPPILEQDFESGLGDWIPSDNGAGTAWSAGIPDGTLTQPDAAANGTQCAGTNIDGIYTNSASASLITPAFTVPAGGATLNFSQYIDTEVSSGGPDFGSIRLLNAADDSPLGGGEVAANLQGISEEWTSESIALPAAANGQEVKLMFLFQSDDAGQNYAGFYIDDVVVKPN